MSTPADHRAACVDDVLITPELDRRPRRAPDYEAENRALVGLAAVMADSSERVFQSLADSALELCRAGSAGVSVWDPDGPADVVRWRATAGAYAPHRGHTLPRSFSPCGTALDRGRTLLMDDPARFFPHLADLSPPVREVLLVPFHRGGVAVGTVWVAAHAPGTHFDAEAARLVASLTRFAGAAAQLLARVDAAEAAGRSVRDNEERFRTLVTATSDVVYRMSPDWTEMRHLVGREFIADTAEPSRTWLDEYIPADERGRVADAIAAAVRDKRTFELEHRVLRVDGSVGWTFSRAIPVLDPAGAVTEWFGAASDVTGRKRAEEELRDIRSRMESALEAGAIGTWAWDVPNDRFHGDASLARIFAVPPAAVDGGPLAALLGAIHPDDRDRVADLVARAVETGGRYEAAYRVTDGAGGWRWVTARGQVERDAAGNAVRFPGVVIDVTERKRAEAELARVTAEADRRTRLYEAVLSTTPDLAYVWGLDHRFLYANEGLLRMWGKTWDEAIGKNCLELGYEPWHAAMHDREIEQVRATKAAVRGEVPFAGTFGRRIYDYLLVPVIGADGEVEAVTGITRDVTDRQAMEQELRDQDRKKDDFIALLAHELRNPLAPIRNGLQVLRLGAGNPDALAKARDMMDRQLTHMVRLIDDLLDVSRINRNKMELRRGRVPLADVVAAAVETARPALDAAGHDLTVSLPAAPVVLDADLTRLAQVFSNLLTNSAKYTPRGGRVWMSAERANGRVAVAVRDTGIGIPEDALPTIFDMFSQVDRSTEKASGGLGIGLALVKGLVEMHGGTVTAASDGDGRGTTFTVSLPEAGPAEAPPPAADGGSASGPARRILVVDDNQDGAESMAVMLGLLGHEVRTAFDGVEALAAAETFRPDVILMDVGMPRLNGLDATRRIREQPWGRDIAVVALTGWGQENDREKSRAAGCDGHLVKPVDVADLQRVLADVAR